jgi:hypothetical protein
MLDDRPAPAARALVRLKFVLEQTGQQDDQIVFDRALLAAPHVFDLFEQIDDVEVPKTPFAQRRRLFREPQVEVALIEPGVGLDPLLRACHVSVSTLAAGLP